jgi:hypothetical protein
MTDNTDKILGGFYIYNKKPGGSPSVVITGIVIFKTIPKTYKNKESKTVFFYSPLPEIETLKKEDYNAIPEVDVIQQFINQKIVYGNERLYDYTENNIEEFIAKCFKPPISFSTSVSGPIASNPSVAANPSGPAANPSASTANPSGPTTSVATTPSVAANLSEPIVADRKKIESQTPLFITPDGFKHVGKLKLTF